MATVTPATIADVIARIGQNRANDYLYDPLGVKTVDQIAQMCLDTAIIIVQSYCDKYKQEYDNTNDRQDEATKFFAIAEIYAYSNNESTGEDERILAEKILLNTWSLSSDEDEQQIPAVTPFISITASTGRTPISEIDIFTE